MVNAYLRETMGGDFSAKDFRTWHATQGALLALAQVPLPEPTSERALAVTDGSGRYLTAVTGHHGAVRVRVAREGFQPAAREMHFIKSSRDLTFNFSLPPVQLSTVTCLPPKAIARRWRSRCMKS